MSEPEQQELDALLSDRNLLPRDREALQRLLDVNVAIAALCRRDGDGHSCAACDQFIAEVHAAIDQGILEQRKELKPNKWDMFKRR
jgi:hypothetical protein